MSADWIETYTGVSFFSLNPSPDDVRIEDIAHALSQKCRFNGHTSHFYSVAAHSINVQRELEARGADVRTQLIGLLHDASEAYLPDVPSPIKPLLNGFKEVEKRVEIAIFNAFGLHPNDEELVIVKGADNDLLAWEAHKLMPCRNWSPKPKNKIHIDRYVKGAVSTVQDVESIFMQTFGRLADLLAREVDNQSTVYLSVSDNESR